MSNSSRGPLAYTGVRASSPPQQIVNRQRAPTSQDYLNFNIGDLWLYMNMNTPADSELYQLVSNAENVATWNRLSDTNQVWPNHAVVLGSGTDAPNSVSPTTSGYVLTSNGPSADPTWQAGGIKTLEGNSGSATGNTVYIAGGTGIATSAGGSTVLVELDRPVSVLNGGTGDTSLTAYAPMCGGTTAFSPVQAATTGMSNVGYVLTSTGTASLPTWQAAGGGGGGIENLDGDTGTATGTTVNIVGGTGITTSAATDTVTVDLDSPVVVANGGSGLTTTTPYAIFAAGTTSTGNFQQVSGLGTSGQVLTSAGAGALPTWQTPAGGGGGGSLLGIQVFDTPGADTYTPTAGMENCMVVCVGGGGGGRGASTVSSPGFPGQGGGGGAYSQSFYDAATIGASQDLFVGDGGAGGANASVGVNGSDGEDTTFGTVVMMTAGGGNGGAASVTPSGGVATGGDLNISGQNGGNSFYASTDSVALSYVSVSGSGGSSLLGFGGISNPYNQGIPLPDGQNYGGGGAGSASSLNVSGNGAQGVVIVYEYGGGGSGGGGSEVFIATLTANNDTELVFDATMIDSTYSMYKFRFDDLFLDNTGTSVLNFTVSTDDGGTYIGSPDYKSGTYSGVYSAGLTATSSTLANGVASTATYNSVNGYLEFYNTQSSDYASWIGETIGDDGVARFGLYQGTVTIPDPINNIKFESSGGTLTSGTISLYGISTTGGGGGGSLDTLTGDDGGPVSPTAGNIDIIGEDLVIEVVGNPGTSTMTVEFVGAFNGDTGSAGFTTGVGELNIVGGVGITTSAATDTVTIDLDSPVDVVNGGTGNTSLTAFAPVCGGVTATSGVQAASSGMSNVGYVLTSTGAASLPTWQASGGGSGVQTLTGDDGGAVSPTANNIDIIGEDLVIEVVGDPGTSTLTVEFVGAFNGDTGSAGFTTGVGELNVIGGTGITTSAATDTVTINLDVPVVVANGGTGLNVLSTYALLAGGTTGTGNVQQVSGLGTSGQVLTSAGAGALPTWQTPSGGSLTLTGDDGGAVSPTAGNIDIIGEDLVIEVVGNPGTSTLEVQFVGAFNGDTGSAGFTTGVGELNIVGGTGITTSATGDTVTITATGGSSGTIVTEYTSGSGTHTFNASTKFLDVILVAGGTGGGSGRRGSSGASCGGGGGGNSMVYMQSMIPIGVFGATTAYQVGAGGAGGAAVTTDSTNGNDGSFGTDTSFGNLVAVANLPVLDGYRPGIGGGTVGGGTDGGGGSGGPCVFNVAIGSGAAGGRGDLTTNGIDGFRNQGFSISTGAGGGGGAVTGTPTDGGNGGSVTTRLNGVVLIAGVAGGATGGNGTDGLDMSPTFEGLFFGTGGGGGGGNDAGPGGNGGNGGYPGGPGGGGGASLNGNNSGAGGDGADGWIQVIEYL